MLWIILVSLLLIFILLFIAFLRRVTINLSYSFQLFDTHRLSITIMVRGFQLWKKTIQLPTIEDVLDSEGKFPHKFPLDREQLITLLKKLNVSRFYWETGVGLGEAHITGPVAGSVWALKEMSVRLLESHCTMAESPTIQVKPNYEGEGLYSRLDCTFHLDVRLFLKLRSLVKEYTD